MKKHKKSEHTYHAVRYQCNECDFMANEVETLDVHLKKNLNDFSFLFNFSEPSKDFGEENKKLPKF